MTKIVGDLSQRKNLTSQSENKTCQFFKQCKSDKNPKVNFLHLPFQEVPEKSKDSPGGPWKFCGLLPLFDPPRHDSAETIRRALNLGVCVKMITGK